ncbi:MAG TPA: glycosyltransferase family 1 protein [Terracidiphilus sp.]
MRVAVFTETFLPKTDGIVTTICQTIRHLRRLGHEVLVVAPESGLVEYEGCRIVGVPGRKFPFYPELRLSFSRSSVHRILEEFQPDLVHAVEPACLGLAALYLAGGSSGGRLRAPLILSYHTDLPKYLDYFGLRFLEPFIWPLLRLRHKRATVNLCTSESVVRDLEKHGIARVALWPGAVDSERFAPGRRSEAMRSRLTEGRPESPLLLYAGRLSVEKGIERLLPVLRANPGARLALIGDGPHRAALQQHFAGMPVHMTGFLHGNELAEAFASSDIFVMPSETETLGLVVLEAMASGLPVVAARAGGIPEMIDDGVNGFLFEGESQGARIVGRLINDGAERKKIGLAARPAAMKRNWATATQVLLQHYRSACAMQHIAPAPSPDTDQAGAPFSARGALGAATIFALRKLLP